MLYKVKRKFTFLKKTNGQINLLEKIKNEKYMFETNVFVLPTS